MSIWITDVVNILLAILLVFIGGFFVADEYGTVIGCATLEDVLERIVGPVMESVYKGDVVCFFFRMNVVFVDINTRPK